MKKVTHMENTISIDNIDVYVKLINNGFDFAHANIIICKVFEIHGFRISKSQKLHPKFQEMIWIQFPKYPIGGFYKYLIFVTNKKLYNDIEEKIYNQYNLKRQQSDNKRMDENVNPNTVPI